MHSFEASTTAIRPIWRFQLLGGLRAHRVDRPRAPVVEKFKAQKNAALLAYLAQHPKSHSREVIQELFWPDTDPKLAQNGLRVALSNLRNILEPEGVPKGSLIDAGRQHVALVRSAFVTDVAEFWNHISQADAREKDDPQRVVHLERAASIYQGPFMQGHYDGWITAEAGHIENSFYGVLRELIAGLDRKGKLDQARDWALRAVTLDPLREEFQQHVLRYCPPGEEASTLRRYETWHRKSLAGGEVPSALIEGLARDLRNRLKSNGSAGRNAVSAEAPEAPGSSGALAPSSANGHRKVPVSRSEQTLQENRPSTRIQLPAVPRTWTTFLGREEEVRDVVAMLAQRSTPIVTLTGPGGSGKTRLAIQVANALLSDAMDSGLQMAAFTQLADVTNGASIPATILDAMGEPPGPTGLEAVIAALEDRYAGSQAVIILDNAEHLLESARSILETLLQRVQGLTCLVTSRHRINLPGERDFPLAPLAAPPEEVTDVGALVEYPSVRLLLDRARSAQAGLALTRVNVEAAAGICRKLDGLPLAIELAAARASLFSLPEILRDLESAGARIKGGQESHTLSPGHLDWQSTDAGVPERHRSLRSAIGWSVRQLSPPIARFWARLCVFRDGWTLEDAVDICSEPNAGSHLIALSHASLIQMNTRGRHSGPPRGRMLEALREFAQERLSTEELEELERRHAWRYLGLVETAAPHLTGPNSRAWLLRLDAERQNLLQAVNWFLHNDITGALRMVGRLWWVWELRGRIHEGRQLVDQVVESAERTFPQSAADLARGEEADREILRLKAHARSGAGKLANLEADFIAAEMHLRAASSWFQLLGDEAGEAASLYSLGFKELRSGNLVSARQLCQRSVDLNRALGLDGALADAMYNLSIVALFEGNFPEVKHLNAERLAIHRASGYRRGMGVSLETMGLAALFAGDYDAAAAYFGEGLSIFEKADEWASVSRILWGLGHVARFKGEYSEAKKQFQRALEMARETRNAWAVPYLLEGLSIVAAAEGADETAIRLMGCAAAVRETHREPLPSRVFQAELEKIKADLLARMGGGLFQAHWTLGQQYNARQIMPYALEERALEDAAHQMGDPDPDELLDVNLDLPI